VAKTILIVDDDPNVLDTLRTLLIDDGHTVRTARDGLQALDRLRRAPVDLVVSDVVMPVVDGHKLVQEMRRTGDRTPVILMSSVPSVTHIEPETPELAKPLDFEALLGVIRETLARARAVAI
jgi:DNA-binding NtrC family response regulator